MFEALLANEAWQQLAGSIWWLFIQFELNVGNSAAAKRHFFRAIQICPWSKVVRVRVRDLSMEQGG